MMDFRRRQLEERVLADRHPQNSYFFRDMDTPYPYLEMAVRTNNGKLYTIRIELQDFPTSIPKVFVKKMLYTKDGERMDSVSASMHTLESENGYTRICHYGYDSWTSNVSLHKVYIKCAWWLNIYELHLRTGKPMDYYFKHQD